MANSSPLLREESKQLLPIKSDNIIVILKCLILSEDLLKLLVSSNNPEKIIKDHKDNSIGSFFMSGICEFRLVIARKIFTSQE